eukprot:6180123-Pleurochrysis_carterae.AAC.3
MASRSSGPTIAQDIARLLAIAGTDRVPKADALINVVVDQASDSHTTAPQKAPALQSDLLGSVTAGRLAALQEAPILFQIQTLLAAVAASVLLASLLMLSSIALVRRHSMINVCFPNALTTNGALAAVSSQVPTDELWKYQPPAAGKGMGSLVKLDVLLSSTYAAVPEALSISSPVALDMPNRARVRNPKGVQLRGKK